MSYYKRFNDLKQPVSLARQFQNTHNCKSFVTYTRQQVLGLWNQGELDWGRQIHNFSR